MNNAPVWLITGASRGLGLSLARYALSKNHRVIAASRKGAKTTKVVTEIENQGGTWISLDLGSSDNEIATIVKHAEAIYGRIDILVNNAGYCTLGSAEDIPAHEVEAQMRVNFLGPLSIMRAVLPGMRERRSGFILNVSSSQGFSPSPGNGVYAASKAALEAISDAMSVEVEPFNVRVLLVLPGAFKTQFANSGVVIEPSTPYAMDGHPVAKRLALIKQFGAGAARGDPEKAAQIIFEAVSGQGETGSLIRDNNLLRLFIGSGCWDAADSKVDGMRRNIDISRDTARRSDF